MKKNIIHKGIRFYNKYGIKGGIAVLTGQGQINERKYAKWYEEHRVTDKELKWQKEQSFLYSPVISIVVPVYNTPIDFLIEMIESVRNQSYCKWQLCIANASPYNVEIKEKIKYYLKYDNRIKVIDVPENLGIAQNTNKALDIATGEYFGFVDSDDSIEPFMYKKLISSIIENKTKLAVCAVNYVFENGEILTKPNLGENCTFDFYQAMIEMNSHRIFDMGAWSKLYHRDLFFDLRFPEGKLSEDYYIMYKIFDRAQTISYVSTPCYNYLQRQNSITHNVRINHDHEYAAREQMEYLEKKYPELKVLGHTAYASAALTVYDSYIKNAVSCPQKDIKHFKSVVQENKQYIKNADFLSKSKKVQFQLFLISTAMYNIVFKVYRKIKRV